MTTAVAPAPTLADWTRILGLFVAGLFAAAQFAKVAVALPWLAQVYPQAGGWLPFAVSVNGLAGVVLGVMAGGLVAREGPRRMLALGLAGGGALSLVEALLPGFAPFMVLRLAEGATHLVIVVAAPTLMAASAPGAARPVAMGLWGTFVGIGFAATAVLGAPLLDLGGVPMLFAAHGAGMLALAVILPPILPKVLTSPERLGWTAAHLGTYGSARRAGPALGFVWYTLNFVALMTLMPPILGPQAAVVLPVVALVGTFGAGFVAKFVAPMQVGMAGFALTMITMPAVWLVPEAAQLPVAALAFCVMGMVPGATFAAVPALNPLSPDQAKANGAIAQLGNVGSTFGTPLFAVALMAGPMGLSLMSSALCLGGIATLAILHGKVAGDRDDLSAFR